MNTKNQRYTMTTKAILVLSATAITLGACQSGNEGGEFNTLVQERDSLKAARKEISAQIQTLEERIQTIDTNRVIRVINVTTMEAKPESFEHYFTVQGIVETDQNAQLFPEAAGRVTSIWVKEGTKVVKGQKLITLDNSIVVKQIQELKSRLSLAENVYKKQEKLWDQKVGSEIQYLEAKNNYESLKQNMETLMAQNDLYVINAPFGGVIDEINIKEGEMAGPQMPVIRLINTDDMYIKSDVTERYLDKIKAGDSVRVFFPGINDEQHTTIARIGEFINPNNRTFKIRLSLKNDKDLLKPNLLGELNIRDYVNDSTVVIPSSMVQMTPSGDEFVFLLEDNKTKKVAIETGMTYNDRVEILSGLSGGEVLIDKGARSIKDGDTVNVLSK